MRTKDGIFWMMIGLGLHIMPCIGVLGYFSMIVGLFYLFKGRNEFSESYRKFFVAGFILFIIGLAGSIISWTLLYLNFLTLDTKYLFVWLNITIYLDALALLILFLGLLLKATLLAGKPTRILMMFGLVILVLGLGIINRAPIIYDEDDMDGFSGFGSMRDDFDRRVYASQEVSYRYLFTIPVESLASLMYLIGYAIIFMKLRKLEQMEQEELNQDRRGTTYAKKIRPTEPGRRRKSTRRDDFWELK